MGRKLLAAVLGMMVVWGGQTVCFGFAEDPAGVEYFTGQDLQMPQIRKEKAFRAEESKANFTYFGGVEGVAVQEGSLRFTLTDGKATLGWGNYANRQSPQEFKEMWPSENEVVLRIRQSGGKSTFAVYGWVDNRRMGDKSKPVTLEGTDWQELNVGRLAYERETAINPDGFELEITGEKGTIFQVSEVKLAQSVCEGYVRREFVIPAGKIWRAVADIGGNPRSASSRTVPYINGKQVAKGESGLYGTEPVDILPYLRNGSNCIGLYGFRVTHSPFLYFQATIIMESGEVIRVVTEPDGSWKTSPKGAPGWNEPGFDDSAWSKLEKAYSGINYQLRYNPKPSGYTGRLVIENPAGRYLFYREDQDIVFEVRTPRGLAQQQPQLSYLLARAGEDGASEEVARGTVKTFAVKGNSLVYSINAGRLEQGVYTIALDLATGDAIIESRAREPFIVSRRHGEKTTPGKTIFDGLDLELEDQVDFTNPNDPHPWIEVATPALRGEPIEKITKPTIVRKKGLVYRQTRPRAGSVFSYRLNEFKHPGDFYLMELEYPDDAQRLTEVFVVQKAQFWSERQSSVAYQSGGRLYNTGGMQKLYWLHVADPGVHSVDVYNGLYLGAATNPGAAAKSLKIYHIKGELPALECGNNRRFGIHTERQTPTNGAGQIFGSRPAHPNYSWMERRVTEGKEPWFQELVKAQNQKLATLSTMDRGISGLVYFHGIADRYAQYLKFVGQNNHIIGCYQYHEGNTPLAPAKLFEAASVPRSLRRIMAEVFDLNDITFHAGLEVATFLNLDTRANNLQVTRGDDTMYMVDEEGKQYYRYRYWYALCQNWVHPKWREGLGELLRTMTRTFGHLDHFKGVHMLFGPVEVAMYPPAFVTRSDYSRPYQMSYDDESFRQFGKDCKIKLPVSVDDPLRFEKRAQLMKYEQYRGRFRQWRCDKFYQVVSEALSVLKKTRKDLELLGVMCTAHSDLTQRWLESGKPLGDFLKDFAIDLALFKHKPDLCLGRWTIGWREASDLPYMWVARENPDYAAAFDNSTRRYVLVRTSWRETAWHYTQGSRVGDWGYPKLVEGYDWVVERTTQLTSHPQYAGFHCREAFVQAIITADPDFLVTGFTDHALNIGHESELRPLTSVFASLPQERFQPVLDTGLTTNVALRQLNRKNDSYFYVANPGYWHLDASIELTTDGKVLELVSGREMKTKRQGGAQILQVSLEPYGLAAFRIASPRLKIASYTTGKMSKQERAHMETIIKRVESLTQDRKIRVVMLPDDSEYMRGILEEAKKLLNEDQYAAAWATLKQPRFWTIWQDFLERAAPNIAFLPETIKTERQENIKARPIIKATPAPKGITVDGRLNEKEWSARPFRTGFVTNKNRPGMAQTAVNALYDKENLYFAFACADRTPEKIQARAKNEMQIWSSRDDVAVIFLQSDETLPTYYQLAFNTQGLRFDQRNVSAERDYTWNTDWTTAAYVDKSKGFWSAEAAIPFSALGLNGPGTTKWRINFHRVFRNNLVDPVSWSSPYGGEGEGGSWHSTERFGRLEFE